MLMPIGSLGCRSLRTRRSRNEFLRVLAVVYRRRGRRMEVIVVGDDSATRGDGPSFDSLPLPRGNRVPKRKPRPGIDPYGCTPLWLAVADGDLAAILRELDGGADPSQADDDGFTPLHVAALSGRPAAAEVLLERGADPNRVDHHGNGPLWTAAHESSVARGTARHVAVLALLLGAGADVERKNRYGRCPRDILSRSGLEHLVLLCKPREGDPA